MIRFMPIGMRIVKTSLAVMLCLALGRLLGWPAPVYACIAATMTLRETVGDSVKYSVTRSLATLFGGVIGMLILGLNVTTLNPWIQIPVIGLAVMLTIYFTVLVKRPDTTGLAVIVLLIIVLDHADDKYIYALRRIIETILGIVVAVGINRFINFKSDGQKSDLI